MRLEKRTAALIRQKQDEAATLKREIENLQAVSKLKLATQYALDFAASGECIILREELEHDIAEDLKASLELEDGQVSRLIEEAVAAQELYTRLDEIFIPAHTLRKAGIIV